jgi:serine/threonine protein kinase
VILAFVFEKLNKKYIDYITGDNLLLDGQGSLKIGDFGIAIQKRVNDINESFFVSGTKGGGTPHWTAHEILNGQGSSRRSDIW